MNFELFKKFNKSKVLKVVLITGLLSFLAACTQNNNNNNSDGGNAQIYDIVWWGLYEKQETIQPLIDKFKSQNQNINIQYVQITDGVEDGVQLENYRVRLDENLTDNEPLDTPDIITIGNTWLGRYAQYLSPAPSTNFTGAQITSDYFPVVAQDFVRGSSVYAVPQEMDSLALIINKDLMVQLSPSDSAGPEDNWFDFKDQAERVTTYKSATNEVNIAGFSGGSNTAQFMTSVVSLLLLQSNITMTNVDPVSGFSTEAVFASDSESDTLLEFYKKFTSESLHNTWDNKMPKEVAAFLSKRLVMYAAPSWRLNDILRLNERYNLGLNLEVYPMPQINPADANAHVHWADYWGTAVTLDSQKRGQSQVAWDFLRFINEDDNLRLLRDTAKNDSERKVEIIFPKKSLAEGQKSDEFLKVYIESLEKAKTWDMVDGYLVDQIFKAAFAQNSAINSTTIEDNINTNVLSKRTTLLTEPTTEN